MLVVDLHLILPLESGVTVFLENLESCLTFYLLFIFWTQVLYLHSRKPTPECTLFNCRKTFICSWKIKAITIIWSKQSGLVKKAKLTLLRLLTFLFFFFLQKFSTSSHQNPFPRCWLGVSSPVASAKGFSTVGLLECSAVGLVLLWLSPAAWS